MYFLSNMCKDYCFCEGLLKGYTDSSLMLINFLKKIHRFFIDVYEILCRAWEDSFNTSGKNILRDKDCLTYTLESS